MDTGKSAEADHPHLRRRPLAVRPQTSGLRRLGGVGRQHWPVQDSICTIRRQGAALLRNDFRLRIPARSTLKGAK